MRSIKKYCADLGAQFVCKRLDEIRTSADHEEACGAVLRMLNGLSDNSEAVTHARRGAAVALVNVIKRGLEATRMEAV